MEKGSARLSHFQIVSARRLRGEPASNQPTGTFGRGQNRKVVRASGQGRGGWWALHHRGQGIAVFPQESLRRASCFSLCSPGSKDSQVGFGRDFRKCG